MVFLRCHFSHALSCIYGRVDTKIIPTVVDRDRYIVANVLQPRHMDMEQVKQLSNQLDTWTVKVKTVLNSIEDQTPELFN